jgi:hypothetical protein
MKAMKKLALAMLCLVSGINARSQSEDFTTSMDSLFAAVSKAPVTSGIWYDRAFCVARLHEYDATSDTVEGPLIEQAYFEIYNAAYNKTSFFDIDEYSYIAKLERFKQRLPVSVIDYTLQYVNPDALQQGLLSYTNGLFYNTAGQPNPFNTKRVQMAGPLKENVAPGWVRFSLPDLLCAGNNGLSVQSVQLNFGAAGSITLGINQVDSINFPAEGEKIFMVTTTFTGGQQFTNKCRITVGYSGLNSRAEGAPPTEINPCYSEAVQSQIPFQGYNESQPFQGWNTVNYYYRSSVACDKTKKTLNKPVIIIDGFDPTNKRLASWINDNAFLYYNPNTNRNENLGQILRDQDNDLIIVNHPDYIEGTRTIPTLFGTRTVDRLVHGGGDYTERNAMVLVKIIQNIRDSLAAQGSTDSIIVVGPSMGGQISRIALKYMENNIATTGPHKCKLWISMDSHQQGSVVPIGLQLMAREMARYFYKARVSYEVQVNAPIARQVLIHHNLSNSETPAGAPDFFDRYHTYMSSLGYPQNLRKVAGNSGAHNGQLQNPGFTCLPVLELGTEYSKRRFFNFIETVFGSPEKKQKISLSPDKIQNRCRVLDMNLKFGPKTLVKKELYARHPNNGLYNCSLEMLPGGNYPGFKEIVDSLNSTSQIHFASIYDLLAYWMRKRKWINGAANLWLENHTHQVTGSTLGYGLGPNPNPNRKWDDNITGLNLSRPCLGEIPFDGYFGPSNFNTRHDALFYEQAQWFINEINGIPQNNPPAQGQGVVSFSTPTPVICSGQTIVASVTPVLPNMVYNWTTSTSFLQIISGQGTPAVTIRHNGLSTYNGPYTVNCTYKNICYDYSAEETIYVGKQPVLGWYNSPYNPSQPLNPSGRFEFNWNDACYGEYINTSMNVWPGTTITWQDAGNSGGVTWWQNGNNLQFYFSGPNQWAYFRAYATNTCGTNNALFRFRSVDGDCGGPPLRISIAPNPAIDKTEVFLFENNDRNRKKEIFQIRVMDKTGNVIRNTGYGKGTKLVALNVSELKTDVYLIMVFDGIKWTSAKFIKQ